MSWSSSITHPGYRPDLYDTNQSLEATYGNTRLEFSHTHQQNKSLRALVFEILKDKEAEEAKIMINKMLNNVKRCCNWIKTFAPEESTSANSSLRSAINQQVSNDESIITFLDTVLINMAMQKGLEQKAENKKNSKSHKTCELL